MPESEYWEDVAVDQGLGARSVRGASITAVAQALRFVLMIANQAILARLLLPADFGLVAMVAPVTGLVLVVADLGFTQAIVARPRLTRPELTAFFWIGMGLCAGLAMLAAASAPLLWLIYGDARVIEITVASAALVIVSGLGTLPGALLNRQLRFGPIAVAEVAALATSVAVGASCAWAGLGYWSLIAAQGALSAVNTAILWSCTPWRPGRPALLAEAWQMARFGGNVSAANLAGYANMNVDKVLIGATLGEVLLGIYDRAWRLVVLPMSQIQTPFNRVALPALSRFVDEPDRYRRAFEMILQAMLLLVVPAMMFASVMSADLIAIILGRDWVIAAPAFALLCFGGAITPVNMSIYWLLISQARARDQMVLGIAAAALNIAGYVAGLPWGVMGLITGSVLSVYLLQTPLLIVRCCRIGPVGRRHMVHLLAPNVLAAGVATLCVYIVASRLTGVPGLLLLLLGVVAAYGGYLLALAPFARTRRNVRSVLEAVATLRSGRGS